MSKEVMQQALEALEHCQDVIIERGLGGNAEFAEMWGLQLPLDRAGHAIEALRAAIEEKPSKAMTASRAEMFMRRFKHEEKLLGPNEQAALDFVIDILVSLQEGWELTVAEKPAQATIKAEDVVVETYTVTRGGFELHPQSGVRLTHKPSGTVVQCDAERSLHRNRETAWKDLEKILSETTPVPEPASVTYKEVAEVMNSLWAGTTRDVQIAQVLAPKKLYIDPPAAQAPVQAPALVVYQGEIAKSNLPKGFTGALYTTPPATPVQPVKKCAQCKKEYTQGKARVGCPKCAPNVSVPESEFQKPITPPAAQRQWVGLTDEDRQIILDNTHPYNRWTLAERIEAKLKEKNA